MIPGIVAGVAVEGVPPAFDPHWASVITLLHFDGSNGSTNFPDVKGRAWSRTGGEQISTARSRFGGASGYFSGTNSGLIGGQSADFAPGTGDFTYEMWCYADAYPDVATLVCLRRATGPVGDRLYGNVLSLLDGYPAFSTGDVWLTSSIAAPLNAWVHLAASRVSGTLRIFVNGAIGYEGSDPTNYGGTTRTGYIGRLDSSTTTEMFTGYIDELRLTKGVGRYTAAFTPPSAPFPEIGP